MDRIMLPAIAQMNREGTPFTGFLYAGLMMTAEGPKILEFNVRLGDPECQVLMHSFRGDVATALFNAAQGKRPDFGPAPTGCSACVVLAAEGYPEKPRTGDVISGLQEAETSGATIFHAGTKLADSNLVTNGGRVLGVTAAGGTLPDAIANAYRAAKKVQFEGMHYRSDIGSKGLRRW
jgi:phosphoribosylamine--glycine ligase